MVIHGTPITDLGECLETIHDLGTGWVSDAVRDVAGDLWDWSKNILGDLEKRIKAAKKSLEVCRRRALTSVEVAREQVLRHRLERLEEQWDIYWR
uniref:Uncharacterized protein n=1 Tax=Leersia perrieri TaxID=77586 RepID=A0A0D9WB52_9ORYZ